MPFRFYKERVRLNVCRTSQPSFANRDFRSIFGTVQRNSGRWSPYFKGSVLGSLVVERHEISLLWFTNEPWNWHILVSSSQIPLFHCATCYLIFVYSVYPGCYTPSHIMNHIWSQIIVHAAVNLQWLYAPTAEWPTYIANNTKKCAISSVCVCVT
jgi:hypothetical protein